jgi:hypothetical protein
MKRPTKAQAREIMHACEAVGAIVISIDEYGDWQLTRCGRNEKLDAILSRAAKSIKEECEWEWAEDISKC